MTLKMRARTKNPTIRLYSNLTFSTIEQHLCILSTSTNCL